MPTMGGFPTVGQEALALCGDVGDTEAARRLERQRRLEETFTAIVKNPCKRPTAEHRRNDATEHKRNEDIVASPRWECARTRPGGRMPHRARACRRGRYCRVL